MVCTGGTGVGSEKEAGVWKDPRMKLRQTFGTGNLKSFRNLMNEIVWGLLIFKIFSVLHCGFSLALTVRPNWAIQLRLLMFITENSFLNI